MIFRTIIIWAVVPPVTTVFFLFILISRVFDRSGNSAHSIGVLWARTLLFLAGVRVEVEGIERIPKGPVILVSNHRGAFDIPVLQGTLPVQFRWLAKKSLFKIPVLGWSMSLSGYIPIEREHAGRAYSSIEKAAERIKAGTSVLIFPEGTRSATERLLPFKRGGFMLASRSGVPIVPMAIRGTEDIVRKGNIFVRPSGVKLIIGDPIETKGFDEKELKRKTRRAIDALIEGLL
jgi:1-acyl-sn-glycerol-3-phosphate acyltransferase